MDGAVKHFNTMTEDYLYALNEDNAGSIHAIKERWTCLPKGWKKVNMDAVYKNNKASLAFVIRDDGVKIMKLASNIVVCSAAMKLKR